MLDVVLMELVRQSLLQYIYLPSSFARSKAGKFDDLGGQRRFEGRDLIIRISDSDWRPTVVYTNFI